MEVQLILHRQIRSPQLQLHGFHVFVRELSSLEICQTPIGLAKARQQFDAFVVGSDAVILATACFERVTVTEPDFWLRRVLGEYSGINLNRVLQFSDACQDRGLQVLVCRIARILLQQLGHFAQRGGGLILPV